MWMARDGALVQTRSMPSPLVRNSIKLGDNASCFRSRMASALAETASTRLILPMEQADQSFVTAMAAAKHMDSELGRPVASIASSGDQALNTTHAPNQFGRCRMQAAAKRASESFSRPAPIHGPWLSSARLIVPATECAVQCGMTWTETPHGPS